MDYLDRAEITRHASWAAFLERQREAGGVVLLTTKAGHRLYRLRLPADDTLLVGRESAGRAGRGA